MLHRESFIVSGGRYKGQVDATNSPERKKNQSNSRWLLLIAAFKLLKAAALLAAGIGALHLLRKDQGQELARWVAMLQLAPGKRFLGKALEKLPMLDARKLEEISAATFVYAGLFLTEGIGLALRKRWGEYFTIVVTGSFLPLELWEVFRRVTVPRLAALLVNVAIVVYLVREVRRPRS
jgi:uncharacterized membrane protein (DUF2068 family)